MPAVSPDYSKASEFIWIQRDGTPIHVRAMADKHLIYTIRKLRRHAIALAEHENRAATRGCVESQDFRDAYAFTVTEDEILKCFPTWAALQFERRSRGLEELPV